MKADKHHKMEQADLDAKVSEAKTAVDAGTASAREQADLKLLEQEALAKKLQAKHPPKKAAGGSVDGKLDRALEDSFPSSDPVSFVQAAPGKKADESLSTVAPGNKREP
jgi:hypothetical protein